MQLTFMFYRLRCSHYLTAGRRSALSRRLYRRVHPRQEFFYALSHSTKRRNASAVLILAI
jgi:hypothetical protein